MYLVVFGVNFEKAKDNNKKRKKETRNRFTPKLAPFPGRVSKIAPPTSSCMSPRILAPPVLHMQMKCHRILTFWKNYVFNDERGNLAVSLDPYFSYTS